MEEKTTIPGTEIQLGFEFLRETESSPASAPQAQSPRGSRTGGRSRSLAETLAAAQTILIEAPLSDVSSQLLPLFEFCEAALTRALDVIPTRPGVPFSIEEYRSLRGIGQAQWLLNEAHSKRETKPAAQGGRKAKRNAER